MDTPRALRGHAAAAAAATGPAATNAELVISDQLSVIGAAVLRCSPAGGGMAKPRGLDATAALHLLHLPHPSIVNYQLSIVNYPTFHFSIYPRAAASA